MIQAILIDDNGFYLYPVVIQEEELTNKHITTIPSVGYVKAKWNGTEWVEGATEAELQAWKDSQTPDIGLVKQNKIKQSKYLLESWLSSNPLLSTIHNPSGAYYNVSQEKQTQLTQMITLATLSAQINQPFTPTWNSTSNVCEPWTIEELTALTFQITQYVLPRVKKQQKYEVQINSMTTVAEIESLVIDYDTIETTETPTV